MTTLVLADLLADLSLARPETVHIKTVGATDSAGKFCWGPLHYALSKDERGMFRERPLLTPHDLTEDRTDK